MKNLTLLLVALLFIAGCAKVQETENEPVNKWNGYALLKSGEIVHTLWAGQHIDVGTVTYGIDDNANFYVTYDCTPSGWLISETHMFAGDKKDMPVNKPGMPKIGKFPNKGTHPNVSVVTYTVPLSELPPYEEPGFVVATHAVVNNPDGGNETAWGEGDFVFSDKGWGWYDIYYFNQPDNEFTILYGTQLANDSLSLYHINMTTGDNTLILAEFIGNANGTYDGTAYDDESGNFFFTNFDTRELMINPLQDDGASFSAGDLNGIASGATFYNESFYYIDNVTHEISEVTFDNNWQIATETVVSTIPSTVFINDIAMDPEGQNLYMVGNVNDGSSELITYNFTTDSYSTLDLEVGQNTSIAYSSDGELYAVTSADDQGVGFATYTIDPATGTATLISNEENGEEGESEIEDPISDISRGPLM